MSRTSRDPAGRAHGPCERCGVAFTAEVTTCRPMCPNCGHRALSPPAPRRARDQDPREIGTDEAALCVRLRAPSSDPFDGDAGPTWSRWRLN